MERMRTYRLSKALADELGLDAGTAADVRCVALRGGGIGGFHHHRIGHLRAACCGDSRPRGTLIS
jgi:hypothetical protein